VSQPKPTAPADGAAALIAAADGTGGRRKRYTPSAKTPKAEPPVAAPQEPAQEPETASAPEETGGTVPAPQAAPQPETKAEPPAPPKQPEQPVAEAPAPEATKPTPDPPSSTPSSTTDVAFPATPLRFESVFTRPTHTMDPEMYAMVRQRQEKILKSLTNIVTMFLDRKDEYERAVRTAVAAGFPKDDLVKLAVQYDCGPFLEAVLGEPPPQ
jgi:outer membrane biosynthesis protein TonB